MGLFDEATEEAKPERAPGRVRLPANNRKGFAEYEVHEEAGQEKVPVLDRVHSSCDGKVRVLGIHLVGNEELRKQHNVTGCHDEPLED